MEGVPAFDRRFFRSNGAFSRIGDGGLGGKAAGLIRFDHRLRSEVAPAFPGVDIAIPRVVVLATEVFESFMERNRLDRVVGPGTTDDRVAHAFQQAHLPSEVAGDLRALAEEADRPLAVRSSSRLEDALGRPFAGIYGTKMIPNHQPDPRQRFQRLAEAVKFVFASTYFAGARSYRRAVGVGEDEEAMAVLIQEIVGERHGDRFYPHLSAVARSYSYYPIGRASPEDGVVDLALGLGKTIVDGGVVWTYSPRHPRAPAPFGSPRQMMRETQTRFWGVHMGPPRDYNPIEETEHLVEGGLADAEYDGTLRYLASTYDAGSDRMRPGLGFDGPRVLTFSPLLEHREQPLNDVVLALLEAASAELGTPVEIELAATLPGSRRELRHRPPATGRDPDRPDTLRVGFVQLRGMVAPESAVEVAVTDLAGPDVLLASRRAMGNGVVESIRDVVYVRPEGFEARDTPEIAEEIERMNDRLLDEGVPGLFIGFGRWGSSDPWLGIPVSWGQVAATRVLVEATLPTMDVEPSQGSHFFHNLSSLGVLYFTVRHGESGGVDWAWLDGQPAVEETERVRHVRLDAPLRVRVDGRTRRGVILRGAG